VSPDFEWDPEKSIANLMKHGISFEEATDVFEDPLMRQFLSMRPSISEIRCLAVGLRDESLVSVVFTERRSVVRIISARKASRSERRKYDQSSQGWPR